MSNKITISIINYLAGTHASELPDSAPQIPAIVSPWGEVKEQVLPCVWLLHAVIASWGGWWPWPWCGPPLGILPCDAWLWPCCILPAWPEGAEALPLKQLAE